VIAGIGCSGNPQSAACGGGKPGGYGPAATALARDSSRAGLPAQRPQAGPRRPSSHPAAACRPQQNQTP